MSGTTTASAGTAFSGAPGTANIADSLIAEASGGKPIPPGSLLAVLSDYVKHGDLGLLVRKAHELLATIDPAPEHARALIGFLNSVMSVADTRGARPAPQQAGSSALSWLLDVMDRDEPLLVPSLNRYTVACQLACHAFDLRLIHLAFGEPVPPNTPKWIVERFADQDFTAYVTEGWNLVAEMSAAIQSAGEIKIREWPSPIALSIGMTNGRDEAPAPNVADIRPRHTRIDVLDVILFAIRRSVNAQRCLLVEGVAGAARFRDGVSKDVVTRRLRDGGYRMIGHQQMLTQQSSQRASVGDNDGAIAVRLSHLRNAKAALDRGALVIGFLNGDMTSRVIRQRLEAGEASTSAEMAAFLRSNATANAMRDGSQVVIFQSLTCNRHEIVVSFVIPHTGERVSLAMKTGPWLSQMSGYITARP